MISELGRLLIVLGVGIVLVGIVLVFAPKLGLGRLPGDLSFTFRQTRVYFPIATCILISVVLSLILWLISLLRR